MVIVRRPGRVPYLEGLDLQLRARDRVLAGGADELILLEHDPVVTLGRRGGSYDGDRLSDLAVAVVPVDRGGEATWHGPGQLVGYPIVDTRRRKLSVDQMVSGVGRTLARVASSFGVEDVEYDHSRPGVYVRGRKLGSLGFHFHHGVSTHGFSLNVDCDLEGFAAIVPCGYVGLEMTTLSREVGRSVSVAELVDPLVAAIRTLLPEA